MRTFFQPLVVPLQARGNMGSMAFLKGMLFSPIFFVPLLWIVSHKPIVAIAVGLLVPVVPLLFIYWVTLINYVHLQLPATNAHLLPRIKHRLFVGLLLGWLGISFIATILFALAHWLGGIELSETDDGLQKVALFWLISSGLMTYFVFFIRNKLAAAIIWCTFIYSQKFELLVLPDLSWQVYLLCLGQIAIALGYFFRVTHPNNKRVVTLHKQFANQAQWAKGERARYRTPLLAAIDTLNQYLYLFFMRHRIHTNKPTLYFGLGPLIHWSSGFPIFLIALAIIVGMKLTGLTGIFATNDIHEFINIGFFSAAWGLPFSIVTNSMNAIERTKKEQRLMYLLPNQNQTSNTNRTLFNYVIKNNAISFFMFSSLFVLAKFFLDLSKAEWLAFIIFCALPLYTLILRDFRHSVFNNSKLLIPILLYILIMIISFSAIMYWNLSVWGWNFGLVLVSLILFFNRWNSIMDAPPVLPADCP